MAPRSPALLLLASWLLVAVAGHYNPLVSVCPGEGGSLYCTVLYCTVLCPGEGGSLYCTVLCPREGGSGSGDIIMLTIRSDGIPSIPHHRPGHGGPRKS